MHRFPQAPQFCGSVCTLMHAPPQAIWLALHAGCAPHAPFVQTWLVPPSAVLHAVPLGAFGVEHEPVVGLQVPPTWHGSIAAHETGLDPLHEPLWHVSVCVHASPSLQPVPFAAAGFEQAPLAVSQVPAVWHGSLAVHVTGFDPVHVPVRQTSDWVHAFPSLQLVPSVTGGFEQPEVGLHVPAEWHWSLAVHRSGLLPVHVPAWHASVCVHALPSSHVVPFAALLHAVELVVGWHDWQPFAGFAVPAT